MARSQGLPPNPSCILPITISLTGGRRLTVVLGVIWLLTGQLIRAPTGQIILDDSTELKVAEYGLLRKVGGVK
jgi:hypothetical protein